MVVPECRDTNSGVCCRQAPEAMTSALPSAITASEVQMRLLLLWLMMAHVLCGSLRVSSAFGLTHSPLSRMLRSPSLRRQTVGKSRDTEE